MKYMFSGCNELASIDLNNFNTAKVEKIDHMFFNCIKLTSLDLSSFNTKSVINFEKMFYNCNSLSSLELGTFKSDNAQNMSSMFYGGNSLVSLDLNNFKIQNSADVYEMFVGFNENLKFYINYEFEEKILNTINIQLFHSNNISDIYYIQNYTLKFINEENKRNEYCFGEKNIRFKYNKLCYVPCAEIGCNFSNQLFLCEKAFLTCSIQCKNCIFENNGINSSSASNNTNENNFPIINETSNIKGFICYYNFEIEGLRY